MKPQLLSALSLSALLLACAHDRSKEKVNEAEQARAEATAEADEERAEADGEGRERADRDNKGPRAGRDDVDVPRRRTQRGQMASAGGELPERGDQEASPESEHSADNTGINERDRGGQNLTPMDQGNDQIDIDLTQRIRKAIMKNDDLSFTAKNVKVITRDGQVVLRGPVNSQAEKDAIFKAATTEAGAGRVTNQLEVDQD